MRRLLPAALAAVALAATASSAGAALPPIKHVFVITLENKGYDTTFKDKSDAPYLAKTLVSQGQFLTQYYAIGHASLDNYIAFVSGQPPNIQTQADCLPYLEFLPGVVLPGGVALGQGCVYPASVKTIADQLEAKGLTWKGYMEDMGNGPPGEPKTCRHPPLNSIDHTQEAKVGDQYAARHNPFVYFHSIIDRPTCAANVVPLDRMPADIAAPETTANYTYITPNLCNDAHDGPCVDGKPGKLKSANEFLKLWVPRILASPGFQQGGLLMVTFDEAGDDASACCGQTQGPNTPNNGGLNMGPGGGRTGTVLLSQYIRPGSVNATPYNHYSQLRSMEDLFGLGHLALAGTPGLAPFGPDVYNRPEGGPAPTGVEGSAAVGGCAVQPLPSRRGRFPRGTLIASARIRRSGSAVRVAVRLAAPARVAVSTSARRGGVSRWRGVACRTRIVRLRGRHGRARVAARAGGGLEERFLRY